MTALIWDLWDLRINISRAKLSHPVYFEDYKIFLRLGEIQGLIAKGDLSQARTILSSMPGEIKSYKGSYPDYLLLETALLFLALNEPETALDYLEKSIPLSQKRHLKDFLRHPSFIPLKDHPRFQALLTL